MLARISGLRGGLRSIPSTATITSRLFSSSRIQLGNTLLFIEHKNGAINAASLVALTAAGKIGGDVDGLVVGAEGIEGVVDKAVKINGLKKVHFSKDAKYENNLAEPLAPLIKSIVESNNYTHLFAGHTAVGRDIIPRVSALLDSSQISDIIAIDSEDTFQRPIYAGNALLTIKSKDKVKVVTVRQTAFDAAAEEGGNAEKSEVKAVDGKTETAFVEEKISKSSRPELATAPRVVSGGRALKSSENFVKYIEPLADALNAAVGASRAAVDAGYADNALQVGQTGKIVAPELYLAVGISGAIQHLAGMKDSKTIACINKDPDAPIFQVADLGLVADLYDAVPELTEKIKK
ncbi:hypothetical protein CBS101457_002798 [Exobasidium rhododendri]|nr:hypothetical protein CBS101457_002798 [Exobasidium rhododendri]